MRRFSRQPQTVQPQNLWDNFRVVAYYGSRVILSVAVLLGLIATIVASNNLSSILLGQQRDMELMNKTANLSAIVDILDVKDALLTQSMNQILDYVVQENSERAANDTVLQNQLSAESGARQAADTSINTTICDKVTVEQTLRKQKETQQMEALLNFTQEFEMSVEGTVFNNTVCLVTLRSNIAALQNKDMVLTNSFDMVDMLIDMIANTGMTLENLLMMLTSDLSVLQALLDTVNQLNNNLMTDIMSLQSFLDALNSDLQGRLEALQPNSGMKVFPNGAQTIIISGGTGYSTSAIGNTVTITREGVNQVLGQNQGVTGASVPATGTVTTSTNTPGIVSFTPGTAALTIATVDMDTQRTPGQYMTTDVGGNLKANWVTSSAKYIGTDTPLNFNTAFVNCPGTGCQCGGTRPCEMELNVYTVPAGLCMTTYKLRLKILDLGTTTVFYPLSLKGRFSITQIAATDLYNNLCSEDFYLTADNGPISTADAEIQSEITCISVLSSSEIVDVQLLSSYARSIPSSSPNFPFEYDISISSNCLQ